MLKDSYNNKQNNKFFRGRVILLAYFNSNLLESISQRNKTKPKVKEKDRKGKTYFKYP